MSDILELTDGVFQQSVLLLKTPPDTNDATADDQRKTEEDKCLKLVHGTQISPIYLEPFILGGYRAPGVSFVDCIRYTCVLHNDVGNFWTHFIPFLIWVPWLLYLAKYDIDLCNPYFYPLLCFWCGACSYALFSSVAHAFSCRSFEVRSVCFILDYFGIAMYAFGGAIAGFFYQQSVHSVYYHYKYPILFLEASLVVNATLFGGLSRFYWKNYRFIIRILSFILPYIAAVAPFVQRFSQCVSTGEECHYNTLPLHLLGFVLTFTLAFFFATKIPERFAPGKFDYFCQSHQIFHIIAAIQTTIQMYMVPIDAHQRRAMLESVEGAHPDVFTTFVPFLFGGTFGLLTVGLLGYLMMKGILSSNKNETALQNNKKNH